jgi:hypothetical protein
MRRLFWLALGVTIGVLVMRRLSQIAQRLTPKGFVDSLGGAIGDLAHELGGFVGEVRASMGQRERELREGTGLDARTAGPSGISRAANGQAADRGQRR